MKTGKRTVALPLVAASTFLASLPGAANGPGFDMAAQMVSSSCSGASITMDIDVAVTAASAAPLTLFVSMGQGFVEAGRLNDWTSHGRIKAAVGTVQVEIAPGAVQAVGVCVAQPGANGQPARSSCVTVPLPPPCDGGSGSDAL